MYARTYRSLQQPTRPTQSGMPNQALLSNGLLVCLLLL